MIPRELATVLSCIECSFPLTEEREVYRCGRCGRDYPFRGGRLWAVREERAAAVQRLTEQGVVNRLIRLLRRAPRLYPFLYFLLTPAMAGGFTAGKAMARLGRDARRVVNLGSGVMRIAPSVANVDIVPYENVDIVADVAELPFRDASLDLVICENTLEHVSAVDQAFREIGRVVRPGGHVYVVVPFLYPYHESPGDYFRWTTSGLAMRLAAFEPIATGVRAGPMAALMSLLMRLIAMPLSFGSRTLYAIFSMGFMVILAPLKILDPLFRFFPMSEDLAATIYFFGRRRAATTPQP